MSRRRFLCMYTSLVDSLLMRALPYLIFPIRTSSSAIMNRFVIYRPVDGAGRIRWSFTLFDCWSTLSPAKIHSSTESSFSLSLSLGIVASKTSAEWAYDVKNEKRIRTSEGGGGNESTKHIESWCCCCFSFFFFFFFFFWFPRIFFGGEFDGWMMRQQINKRRKKRRRYCVPCDRTNELADLDFRYCI